MYNKAQSEVWASHWSKHFLTVFYSLYAVRGDIPDIVNLGTKVMLWAQKPHLPAVQIFRLQPLRIKLAWRGSGAENVYLTFCCTTTFFVIAVVSRSIWYYCGYANIHGVTQHVSDTPKSSCTHMDKSLHCNKTTISLKLCCASAAERPAAAEGTRCLSLVTADHQL